MLVCWPCVSPSSWWVFSVWHPEVAIQSTGLSASCSFFFAFVYDSIVGPVCYSLVAELSSTRLRAKTIVIARKCYNIVGLVVNGLVNYQLTLSA